MKLLLDQGLPRTVVDNLARRDIDAVHVGEIGMATATDEEIITKASELDRIIVTLDADFHNLLALSAATGPSVIRLRIDGLRSEPLAKVLTEVILLAERELAQGALVIVEESRIRIRRLPVIRTQS